ncbi:MULTISPECIES: methyltransferase domain-containing protein [unclassified Thalassospira]|uniref:methyltransferase domain-containing protein n=1 Tax=unclassified Thalassospira TaxID=2648997 RepID=UPI000EDB5E5D|nr:MULTISPECIES: methyltransferase domain-containing protein [unclassified Thalassospira]HAI32375.1 phosphoethanolamine methyltransferase [Thalassospira sp.]
MKLKFWQRKSKADDDMSEEDAMSAGVAEEEAPEFEMPPGHHLGLGTRLRAKWEGYDDPVEYYLFQLEIDAYADWLRKMRVWLSRPVEPELAELDLDEEIGRWPPDRIRLYDKLFDHGIMMPGGHEYALELAKPLALDETLSCLEIGARLGGVARVLADRLGVWVTALEPDGELALLGMERSVQAGVQKKVPVQAFDPLQPDFRKGYFNVVYSYGELFKIPEKNTFLQALAETLREHGQLLVTDYVLTRDLDDNELENWAKLEDEELFPWTAQEYKSRLGELKFDIRIAKDESETHLKHIKLAWMTMLSDIQSSGLDTDMMDYLEPEMEMWMNRVKMLENGSLAFYRFYATIN